jgi:hypothetical protein
VTAAPAGKSISTPLVPPMAMPSVSLRTIVEGQFRPLFFRYSVPASAIFR